MKKYRIIKINRGGLSLYRIQKRLLFWWFDLGLDGDIVAPYMGSQYYPFDYGSLEGARKSLDDILNNQKKIIIDEV